MSKFAALYFNELAAYAPRKVALVGHPYSRTDDDEPFCRIALCVDGQRWGRLGDLDDIATAIEAFVDSSGEQSIVAMGRNGRGLIVGPRTRHVTNIPADPGYLFQVRNLSSGLYACGSQRQVWKMLHGESVWTRIDKGLVVPRDKASNPVLHTIHGISEDCLYAGGRRGELFKFNGTTWRRLDVPTNSDISRLEVMGRKDVVFCGKDGALYRGHDDSWSLLTDPEFRESFWGLTSMDGKIFASTLNDVFLISGDKLLLLPKPNSAFAFHRISAADGLVWAAGGDGTIARWDGDGWETYLCPDNKT
jgi:hypothetical protein